MGPLAEFCLLGLLHFTKGVPRLRADQCAHHWDHYQVAELRGGIVLVLLLGAIGTEVAGLAKAFGMYTIGVNRAHIEPRLGRERSQTSALNRGGSRWHNACLS
ncbi:MAG: NAD(P)-dependent oxidoreductase [Solirubrobacteraceae bacterium]